MADDPPKLLDLAFFRQIAENSPDIVCRYRLRPTFRTDYISPSVERLLGYRPEEFYADPELHLKIIHPEDIPKLAVLSANIPESLTTPLTLRWLRKDGESLWIEQLSTPIFDENGELVATESRSRDVTEKVKLEEQLRRSQKMEAVGRLAAGVAHDFNNLMSIMLAYTGLLRRNALGGPTVSESIDMLDETVRHAADLTRQLMAFGRGEVTRPIVVDLNATLQALEPMLRRLIPESISIETELCHGGASVSIDPAQLEQVLVNLVVNARDAMLTGGRLLLRTQLTTPERVTLSVIDDGVGMDEHIRSRMFDPFFTTKGGDRGSGLGLAVAYGIVQESDGRFEVESEVGGGTQMIIHWPMAGNAVATKQGRAGEPAQRGAETVLLVEDDRRLRHAVKLLLEGFGYRVLSADSPEAALSLSASDVPIHLLLTDVVLPQMNGPALAERIRAARPGLRVLYVSGYNTDQRLREEIGQPHAAYLPKPFSEDQLGHAIRQLIGPRP